KLQEKNMYLFIKNKIHEQIKIAAICGAVDFLAYNGFLNTFNHTGNSQKLWINYDEYQPQKTFIKNNVVTDRNLVTANGTSPIDFTLATLKMINFDNDYEIERKMNLYRLGYYKYMHFYS
ncbi:DJ-1/PfpI family protein, partial [Staphylococcus haemolyticus]